MRPPKIPRLDSATSTSAPSQSSSTDSQGTITDALTDDPADNPETTTASPDVFEEEPEIPAAADNQPQAAEIPNSQTSIGSQETVPTQIISSGRGDSNQGLQH